MSQIKREKTLIAVAAVLLVSCAALFAYTRYQGNDAPLYTSGSDVPDPVKAGDPEAAMRHSAKLLELCRKANWDVNPNTVPVRMMLLPDRYMSEDPHQRSDRVSSFCFPSSDTSPELANVALYSDIYVRHNVSRYRGDVSRARPTGFYIVGFKDGRVLKVPVDDARLLKNGRLVFPGTPEYDPDLQKLPSVRAR